MPLEKPWKQLSQSAPMTSLPITIFEACSFPLPDFPHQVYVNIIYKMSEGSWCFIKWTTKLPGKCLTLFRWYFTFIFQVIFIADKYNWNIICSSNTFNLSLILRSCTEAISVCNGVHQNEPLTTAHVLLTHGCELSLQLVYKILCQ